MKIIQAVVITQLLARNFREFTITRPKCGLNLKLQFNGFEDYSYRVEFFKGSEGYIVHCGLHDQTGELEYGFTEDAPMTSDRTVKDLMDKLSLGWMVYKLECMIELGIIKKVSGDLFDIGNDPVLIKMVELYTNKDKLKSTECAAQWNTLGLTLSFEQLLDLDHDLSQYK